MGEMSDEKTRQALQDLNVRLHHARERERVRMGPRGVGHGLPGSTMGMAFRIAVELVVGIGVGLGLGLAIDYGLGTAPWGMIIMFFFGAGAGVNNVFRAATVLAGGVTPASGAGSTGQPPVGDDAGAKPGTG